MIIFRSIRGVWKWKTCDQRNLEMARRFFKIKLSEDAEIQVFIEIVSGLIVNFVVKLIDNQS